MSLDKTLYNDYLCLVALNKQQVQWIRIQSDLQKHWITWNSYLASADSSKHEEVNAMKSVRIVQ